MKDLVIIGLSMLVFGGVGAALGQESGVDPRLNDPAFIKLRDEALAAATCVERTDPVGVSTPGPRYPDALRRARVTGMATTEGIVQPDGRLVFTRVMKTSHVEFGEAALVALKQYRYDPGTCSGKPVPRFVTIVHTFTVR